MAISPLPPPYTPKAVRINFGVWGRVRDVINHAKFQLDRFRGFGENRHLPLTGGIALTTVYALTCYTVILKLVQHILTVTSFVYVSK